jgi:SAM-dependent methyltransferase
LGSSEARRPVVVLRDSGLDIEREEAARVLAEKFVSTDGELQRKVALAAPSTEPMDVMERTIARLETVLRPANPGDGVRYPLIPAPYREWIENVRRLAPGDGRWFLDVGCGTGIKPLMAWKMGFQPFGIDIFKPYLDVAARVCPAMPTKLIDANDFNEYDRFPVIACYNPMIEVRAAARLVQKIVAGMQPGAYLFAFAWLIEVPDCERIEGTDIWRKL